MMYDLFQVLMFSVVPMVVGLFGGAMIRRIRRADEAKDAVADIEAALRRESTSDVHAILLCRAAALPETVHKAASEWLSSNKASGSDDAPTGAM